MARCLAFAFVAVCVATSNLLLAAENVPATPTNESWPCFRGPSGAAVVPNLPTRLPDAMKLLWKMPVTGKVYSGLVVSGNSVIALDHQTDKMDYVRCFNADTGAVLWTAQYDNTGDPIDYGSCPRSTPLIMNDQVFSLGARGQLCSWNLKDGTLLWKKNLVDDYGGVMPNWGYCNSLLSIGGKLIINPGGGGAALLALDPVTGKSSWRAGGGNANYGSFIHATLDGVDELIGYDQDGLFGRATDTGKVIWSKPLGDNHGYVVPTPVLVGTNKLVYCKEGGAFMATLGTKGVLPDTWEATNTDFQLGDSSPVVQDTMVLGMVAGNGLTALDSTKNLATLWSCAPKGIADEYGNLLVGNGRVLALDSDGNLILFSVTRAAGTSLGLRNVCSPTRVAPAWVNGRLYVRDDTNLYCYDLPAAP